VLGRARGLCYTISLHNSTVAEVWYDSAESAFYLYEPGLSVAAVRIYTYETLPTQKIEFNPQIPMCRHCIRRWGFNSIQSVVTSLGAPDRWSHQLLARPCAHLAQLTAQDGGAVASHLDSPLAHPAALGARHHPAGGAARQEQVYIAFQISELSMYLSISPYLSKFIYLFI